MHCHELRDRDTGIAMSDDDMREPRINADQQREGVQPITMDQFAELMRTIQSSQARFESQLSSFKDEMRQGQEEAATKALKRARHERPYVFRRKGNEEQAAFNARLDEALTEAQMDLAGPSTSVALGRAHKALDRGRQMIAERQKLIRIADRSELGWSVVTEYTADELAEDSDDEKRLEKAERSAERKVAKRKKKRVEPSSVRRNQRVVPSAATTMPGPSGMQAGYQIPGRQGVPPPQLWRSPGPSMLCLWGDGALVSSVPKDGQWCGSGAKEMVSFSGYI